MDMATHTALGLHCPDPDTCEHTRERREEQEHRLKAARQVALRTGIPSYDPALIALYGEPDFDDLRHYR